MMSKTHLTIGMATSLAISSFVLQSQSLEDALIALGGGAVGGVLADIDTVKNDYNHDALIGQLLAFGIFVLVIVIDWYLKLNMYSYMIGQNKIKTIIAGIIFLVLYIIGFVTEHRSFTHSLLAMCLFAGCFALAYTQMGVAILLGYASHLILDLLNKKNVPLLYPMNHGICLKLCYASGPANTVLMYLGLIMTICIFGYRIYPFIFH